MSDASKHLARRRRAAKKYRPARVELLLVAEAPPCDTDRYFYFEDVPSHDWLFRYVWEGLTGEKPMREEKRTHLGALRDAGVFLIDLHEGNIAKPKAADLAPEVPNLVERCAELEPQSIVLIKSVVYDVSFAALLGAGLAVIDARMPFPASGQQKKFLEIFRDAIATSGFELGTLA
ncbi:MAG: hypothetical protein ACF8GE_11415 [Phycisphaerales bacterium JB043]